MRLTIALLELRRMDLADLVDLLARSAEGSWAAEEEAERAGLLEPDRKTFFRGIDARPLGKVPATHDSLSCWI
ncbi:hypothetical protein [Leptolyngbya sp. 7M]|uniref:hypothetical protein n=1 Tax=Leptolyngbya sp. 7M TaxID=2812896 RepID=UPI001B8D8D1D|nr:hypothetical protein [Leptolyngbya sp. 7M]QYO65155.1 hypothetical protein JVX88_37655 [Leptolyngbya sp. 7M]